ncbi:MAG TPA: quercetin 2,3-dioxygenase [Gaiellaceae bacterium]|jgi:mannose-6-phosphate isomerase-like protein (cupin superfamily)
MTTATAAEPIWFIDTLARVLVDGEASGGTVAVVENEARRGNMPPLHVHRREEEVFYVLDGRISIHQPDGSIELGPGQAAFAPRDVPHTYRVESETARWLAIATPAGFDAFVREVGEPAHEDVLPPEGREHDAALIGEIAASHGIELLGPPGTMP